jgi:hypothetical protein
MGAKVKRCEICCKIFNKDEIKYTVYLASFDSCGYSTKFKGNEKITRLFGKAKHKKKVSHVCERCVEVASIDEVLGFGKVLPTKNYIPEIEGKGEWCEVYSVKANKFKVYEELYLEDEEFL